MATITEILKGHVTLEVESVDRLYLNGYIPSLSTSGGLVTFIREHLGKPIPSPAVLGKVTRRFCDQVQAFAKENEIPLIHFEPGERKDDRANRMRRERGVRGEVVFIAQEKAKTFSGRKVPEKGANWYRRPGTHRYVVTPYGWKVARLYSRLDARIFRPALTSLQGRGIASRIAKSKPRSFLTVLVDGWLRLLEVEQVSQNCGLSADGIERVVLARQLSKKRRAQPSRL